MNGFVAKRPILNSLFWIFSAFSCSTLVLKTTNDPILTFITLFGIFMLGATRNARIVGNGDWKVGVSFNKIEQKKRVFLFLIPSIFVVDILVVVIFALIISQMNVPIPHENFNKSLNINTLPILFLEVVIIGPIVEEFFFRGWLWNALRNKNYSVFSTASITSFLWLACHFANSAIHPFTILPAAVIFSIIRYRSNSIKATIIGHMLNNLFVFSIMSLALFFQ